MSPEPAFNLWPLVGGLEKVLASKSFSDFETGWPTVKKIIQAARNHRDVFTEKTKEILDALDLVLVNESVELSFGSQQPGRLISVRRRNNPHEKPRTGEIPSGHYFERVISSNVVGRLKTDSAYQIPAAPRPNMYDQELAIPDLLPRQSKARTIRGRRPRDTHQEATFVRGGKGTASAAP